MRNGFASLLLIIAGLCVGLLSTGCKKQAPAASDSTSTQISQQLPEATNVLAALDQKDYETAVSGVAKLKDSVSTPEQQEAYRRLLNQVKDKVLEAAPTDPKAADAVQAIRLLITGR